MKSGNLSFPKGTLKTFRDPLRIQVDPFACIFLNQIKRFVKFKAKLQITITTNDGFLIPTSTINFGYKFAIQTFYLKTINLFSLKNGISLRRPDHHPKII